MRAILVSALLLSATAAFAQSQAVKEKTVTLDTPEKHIVRENYHDDQAVTLSGRAGGGWRLYAGAAIDAKRIDLRMRNVRGTIRFHADSSRIESVLNRRR